MSTVGGGLSNNLLKQIDKFEEVKEGKAEWESHLSMALMQSMKAKGKKINPLKYDKNTIEEQEEYDYGLGNQSGGKIQQDDSIEFGLDQPE